MLASSARKIIAPILRQCPRECGMVTITDVELSRDLSHVTVSISALKEPALALKFLMSRSRELQRLMGQLETHKTPMIRFRIDTTAEEGSRIDELLARASKNTSEDSSTTSQ